MKTDDGKVKGKLSLYCKVLNVSRQAFYKYLERKDLPWKYDYIVNSMYEILNEDQYNDTYGRYRMYKALKLKHQDDSDFYIPSERTIYRIMEAVGLVHRPKRNPHGITKADKNARKADDKLQRDFKSDEPLKKCVTDITEIKGSDGGRCHDNARCESMWARLKDELFYSRNLKSTDLTEARLKVMIWRYYMSYWNNKRICSSNDGLPHKVKRERFYAALSIAA